MEPDRPTTAPADADRPARGASTGRPIEEPDPVEPGRDDALTSREAYEREMAEQGRTEEAQRHGDHIE